MLEREGLVNVEPNRGAIVRSFDPADLLDLYEVRALIEPHAAARAATRISTEQVDRMRALCDKAERRGTKVADHIAYNEELHGIVVEAADSPRLTSAMRAVAGIPREFRTVFWANDEQRAQSLFCHRELVSALGAKQPELAEAVMRMHILGGRDFIWRVIHG
jgi:DNA-binding GntR family transcriptional regulator